MKSKEKTERELKEFGYVMGIALNLLTIFLLWKNNPKWLIPFAISAFFILAAIFIPGSLRKLESLWMKFGGAIGFVMTHVILLILFVVVITPLSLILRLTGKKFLELETDPEAKTYWIDIDQNGSASRHFLPY